MQRATTPPRPAYAKSLDIAAVFPGDNERRKPRAGRVTRPRARLTGLLPVLALLLGALSLPAAAQTPATPTNFKVWPGNAAFTVAWGPVTGANSYLIEWDANTATGFGKTAAARPGAARRTTIAHSATDPVVNGTLYKVRVRACSNANPLGAVNLDCSARTATLTVTPGTPGRLGSYSIGWGDITNSLGKTLHVEWEPAAANGSRVTYDVHYTTSGALSRDAAATASYFDGSLRQPDPAAGWVEILRHNRGATIQMIYGVPYWTYYRVRIRPVNAFGAGAWEEIGYRLVEPVSAPTIAQNVRVAAGDGKLTLTWEAPIRWGDWPPGGYEVQWKLASAAKSRWAAVWTSGAPAVLGPDATRFEFTGQQQGSASVTNGLAYDLRIRPWSIRPGSDGSGEYDRKATPIWYPAKVSGTPAAASNAPTPTVTLSATPNPVAEGSDVRVKATLSSALPYDATIPLSLTHAHGTAEDGDYGSLSSITIAAGFSSATGTITTSRDADTDDETFTVALDAANLPSYVGTGDPSSTGVTVTITDDGTQRQQQQQQPQPAAPPLTPADEESQERQGAGEPPQVEQGELPSDDGGDKNANDEPQPEEQETQQQQAKDASLDLTGTSGPDDLQGGDAGDVLAGRKGDDVLRGGKGDDELRGGKGKDELRGGRGADTLYGGNGDDSLYGDRGADRLLGGNGDDTYTGGPGADRFVFFSGETGDKIITDFGAGDDRIVLRTEAFAWPSVADIIAGVVAQGDRYLVYTLSPGLTVETDTPLGPKDFRVK